MTEKKNGFENEEILEEESENVEEEDLQVFSITDEDDEEHHFALVNEFEHDGKN